MVADVQLPGINFPITVNAGPMVRGTNQANRAVEKHRRELTRAQRTYQQTSVAAQGFITRLQGVAGVIGVGLGVGALAGFGRQAATTADQLLTFSQSTGQSVEALQRFQIAAREAWIETEQANDTVREFQLRLGEAVTEGSGAAFDALEQLNLDARELLALDVDQQLFRIADALRSLPSSQRLFFLDEIIGGEGQQFAAIIDNLDAVRQKTQEATIATQENTEAVGDLGVAAGDVWAAIEAATINAIGAAELYRRSLRDTAEENRQRLQAERDARAAARAPDVAEPTDTPDVLGNYRAQIEQDIIAVEFRILELNEALGNIDRTTLSGRDSFRSLTEQVNFLRTEGNRLLGVLDQLSAYELDLDIHADTSQLQRLRDTVSGILNDPIRVSGRNAIATAILNAQGDIEAAFIEAAARPIDVDIGVNVVSDAAPVPVLPPIGEQAAQDLEIAEQAVRAVREELEELRQAALNVDVSTVFSGISQGIQDENLALQQQIDLFGLVGAARSEVLAQQQLANAVRAEELSLQEAIRVGNLDEIAAAEARLTALQEQIANNPQLLAQLQMQLELQRMLREEVETYNETQREQEEIQRLVASQSAAALSSIITGTADADDALRALGQSILTNITEKLIDASLEALAFDQILSSLGSSGGIGSFLSSLFGGGGGINSGAPGFRQFGGPVRRGQPYIVGERQAELFVPDQSGFIFPDANPAIGGGNTFVYAPNVSNASLEARREIRESYEPFRQGIKADVAVDNRRKSTIRDSNRR